MEVVKICFGIIMQYPISVILGYKIHSKLSANYFISLTDHIEKNSEWLQIATFLYIFVCLEKIWRTLYRMYPKGTSIFKFILHTSGVIVFMEYIIMTLWRVIIIMLRKAFVTYSVSVFNKSGKMYLDITMMSIPLTFIYFTGTIGRIRREILLRFFAYVDNERCLDCGDFICQEMSEPVRSRTSSRNGNRNRRVSRSQRRCR